MPSADDDTPVALMYVSDRSINSARVYIPHDYHDRDRSRNRVLPVRGLPGLPYATCEMYGIYSTICGKKLVMAWSEEALKRRLVARAAELGTTVAHLLQAAGLQRDAFRNDRVPKTGRRIDTLENLATACKWSLAEVMGFDVLNRVQPRLLEDAFGCAEQALEQVLAPEQQKAVIWTVTGRIYDVLAQAERDGNPVDETGKRLIVKVIVAEWRDRPPPAS